MPKKNTKRGKTVAQRSNGIRVVSDGTLLGTKIFNAKTGKAIGLVQSLDIHFDVENPVPYAVLKIFCPETFVEIKDVKKMLNGSVDEPVCKHARDCRERIRLQQEQAAAKKLLPKEPKRRAKKK